MYANTCTGNPKYSPIYLINSIKSQASDFGRLGWLLSADNQQIAFCRHCFMFTSIVYLFTYVSFCVCFALRQFTLVSSCYSFCAFFAVCIWNWRGKWHGFSRRFLSRAMTRLRTLTSCPGGTGQTLRKNKQSLYTIMQGSVIQHPSKVKKTEWVMLYFFSSSS